MDTNTSIETTLKDMWYTRPVRIPKSQGGNALVAGVCEGIGARYQIDPIIVRLAFVGLTLTFGGGIFVYLLLWMNMPRYGMTTSPWRAINTPKVQLSALEKKDRDTGWALLVGLIIFLPSITIGTGGLATASVITLFIATGAFYLLHRAHPAPPAGLSVSTSATTAGPQVDTSHLTTPAGYPHPTVGRTTPPQWDPLGVAPELWHLPEPPTEPVVTQAPKRNRWVGWLVGLGIALFTAIVLVSAAGAYIIYKPEVPVDTTITATDDLASSYSSGIGDATLDLSGLKPLDDDREVDVQHGVGTLTIIPPRDTRVEFACGEGIGTHNCPDTLNEDADGGVLQLNVTVGIGDIEVRAA